jgi:hypothetical protein
MVCTANRRGSASPQSLLVEDASHYQITHGILQNPQRDEACGWYQQGAMSCAHWLAWRVGWDPATAREKVHVARALGKLPENEAELVAMSTYATGAQLERLCRSYRRALAEDESPAPEERTVRRRRERFHLNRVLGPTKPSPGLPGVFFMHRQPPHRCFRPHPQRSRSSYRTLESPSQSSAQRSALKSHLSCVRRI